MPPNDSDLHTLSLHQASALLRAGQVSSVELTEALLARMDAVAECRALVQASRERLEAAYDEHISDVKLLAQVSAYLDRFDQWESVRQGKEPRELLWQVNSDPGR